MESLKFERSYNRPTVSIDVNLHGCTFDDIWDFVVRKTNHSLRLITPPHKEQESLPTCTFRWATDMRKDFIGSADGAASWFVI
jgi:hypothetical protein